ncbi:MAG TPA: SBBP repeat-containing protein, partial [Chthoniobacterales bacterium]|nr:SBBP repeat-containing protein [Chthoniobacterales bacterium]
MKTKFIFAVLIGTALGLAPLHAEMPGETQPGTNGPAQLSEAYGKLPLSFEANAGQTDPRVKFLSRGSGYSLFLTNNEAVLALTKKDAGAEQKSTSAILRMKLVGAKSLPGVSGQNELPGKANYFTGSDPKKWRTDLPTYAKVRYEQVYPGIDLIYYGNQRQLEYDFTVAPGADPDRIQLGFAGAQKIRVDARGDLMVETTGGSVRWQKPVVYQESDGERKMVEGKYLLRRGHQVSFEVAAYDTTKPLIIDPTLVYSTYLGGSNVDQGNAIAVDSSGNAYVTGVTLSVDLPTTTGAFQTTYMGANDVFVTKLNPTGSGLLYSTYLGGGGGDSGNGIAVDTAGNAFVTGFTTSTDFPTTTGAFQTVKGAAQDAFIAKLDPTGSALVYSSYLGGNSTESGNGIAVDSLGNAYVTGITGSLNFPTTVGAFQTSRTGVSDAFVSKLDLTGTTLVYSTYLGGSNTDQGNAIAVDSSGNAYVTGNTFSLDFPTTFGAFQTAKGAGQDAFITKLDPTGSALVYSTYLGGSVDDVGFGIAVDALSDAYVTGFTTSTDFPTTTGAFQTTYAGQNNPGNDVFFTTLNASGAGLLYSTYLGGGDNDQG